MAKHRKLYILSEINEETYATFTKQLTELEREGDEDIELELSSGGGSAYDALAIASRMRTSPCIIKVTAHGYVASAAVIILAYGDIRQMAREAWVMVHEDSGKESGTVVAMETAIFHLRRMEEQWCKLLAETTLLTSAEKWSELHKAETHLSAEQCKRLGLIDRII